MSESNPGGFARFLKSSANKLSSKKSVKFLPPKTTGKDGDPSESKAKSQKEHRRAQVRKAQIEHRQRKQNLIQHLEQDVTRLRNMISTVETDAMILKQENERIRLTLSNSNISSTTVPLSTFQPLQQVSSPKETTNLQSPSLDFSNPMPEFQSPQQSNWLSNSSSSNVSIAFDDYIDASCLQMSPSGSFDNNAILNSPDVFNFPANTLYPLSPTTASSSIGLQRPLPEIIGQASSSAVSPQPDMSTIAVNFILALEHPCRTHFAAVPKIFDPEGEATGHELMASTLLYSHAPDNIFENLDFASWTAPTLELSSLWEMSQSLPKGDFEITPVQAWFMLSQNYETGLILKNLEALKRSIGKFVACWEFGAVMDELKFWDAVKEVMGNQGKTDSEDMQFTYTA